MDEEILKKKFNVWKVLETAVKNIVKESDNLMKNDDEQTLETLKECPDQNSILI